MSEEKELKLACLHQAGGDLDHAQRLFDWVSGSVRATPDSEAAEVSAPKQDKPQQSFNYRHPSKYGTDVPRRCYLEELTPEERAIRDLVDTVERLGAHPLLTATVIQLMKAGEDLADWVDIGLRDKAIAALSPGNDLGLLDDGQQETSPVQSAIDQDKAWQSDGLGQLTPHPWSLISAYRDGYEGRKHIAPHHPAYMREYNIGAAAKASNADIPPAQEAPAIPEDWTRHDGGECPLRAGVDVDLRFRDGSTYFNSIGLGDFRKNWSWDCSEPAQIVAYRENQASAEAERIEDARDGTPSTEQTEHDRPKLTNEEWDKLEKVAAVDGVDQTEVVDQTNALISEENDAPTGSGAPVSSTYLVIDSPKDADAFKETDASAAYAHINEVDEPAGDAAVFAHGLLTEAKEPPLPSWLSMFMGKAKVDA